MWSRFEWQLTTFTCHQMEILTILFCQAWWAIWIFKQKNCQSLPHVPPPPSPAPPSGLACLGKEDYVKERPLVCFVLLLVLVFPCLYYVSLKKELSYIPPKSCCSKNINNRINNSWKIFRNEIQEVNLSRKCTSLRNVYRKFTPKTVATATVVYCSLL